jgi:hypothetical protein
MAAMTENEVHRYRNRREAGEREEPEDLRADRDRVDEEREERDQPGEEKQRYDDERGDFHCARVAWG